MSRLAACCLALVFTCAALPVAAEHTEREIVVTFVDRSVDRPTLGGPGSYTPRGAQYASTTWSRRITSHIARDYGLEMVTEWPVLSIGVHCVVFEVPAGRDVGEVLARLAHDQRVGSAQRMHTFHVLADDPYRKLQGSLDSLGMADAHRYATGRDIVVGVVDTGIDVQHPDLAGQIMTETDLAPEHTGNIGDEVHGTAVAGVIAAAGGNGQGIVGVAPDARVLGLRACWPEQAGAGGAICNSLTLAKALDTVLRVQPRILNLSLAGPEDPLLQTLVEAALARHIIVVAAEPATRDAEAAFPTAIPNVLRVRAAGAGGVAAGVLDAPGTDVLTTFPRGTYNYISGSSFAAAHISGIAALLLQIRPDLSGAEIVQVLVAARGHYGGALKSAVVSACEAIRQVKSEAACDAPAAGKPVAVHDARHARQLAVAAGLR
ncbi:MAG: S8 family serine peptidase [Gammaproteobacteria bacterium]|nr:S8 family serine peptidase [Gammaproteobacteria bacterium]MBI5615932.1 S8 family serine peptidase [Gammaproteobacteria bacterium]